MYFETVRINVTSFCPLESFQETARQRKHHRANYFIRKALLHTTANIVGFFFDWTWVTAQLPPDFQLRRWAVTWTKWKCIPILEIYNNCVECKVLMWNKYLIKIIWMLPHATEQDRSLERVSSLYQVWSLIIFKVNSYNLKKCFLNKEKI